MTGRQRLLLQREHRAEFCLLTRVVLRVSEGVGSLQGLSITHVILYSGIFESFRMLDTAFAIKLKAPLLGAMNLN
jgi:hypothetical protein